MKANNSSTEGKVRYKTYVKGLDEKIQGGIPMGTITLISGLPGSMKSTLAYNILYRNAREMGLRGSYFTIEEDGAMILENMKGMGMDDPGVEALLTITDVGMEVVEAPMFVENKTTVDSVWRKVLDQIREQGIDLLVIDSVDAFIQLSNLEMPRRDLFSFLRLLKRNRITTFLISEMSPDSRAFSRYLGSFVTDNIIHMNLVRDDKTARLHIGIAKMRGTDHTRDYFALRFEDGGFRIRKSREWTHPV